MCAKTMCENVWENHVQKMCGKGINVWMLLMCGGISTCGSYSCVKKGRSQLHMGEAHVWSDIHVCEKCAGVVHMCEKCVQKTCGKMYGENMCERQVQKMWGGNVCEKCVGKTYGMEGTSHQSDILHSFIFYYTGRSSNVQCMLTPISSILNKKWIISLYSIAIVLIIKPPGLQQRCSSMS